MNHDFQADAQGERAHSLHRLREEIENALATHARAQKDQPKALLQLERLYGGVLQILTVCFDFLSSFPFCPESSKRER